MDMHVDTRWRRGGGFDGKMTDHSMQHAYLLTRVSPQLHTTTKSSQKQEKKIKESLDSLGGMLQNDAVTECLVSD